MSTLSRNPIRPLVRLSVATLALVTLAACGSDDGNAGAADAGAPPSTTSSPAESTPPATDPTTDPPTDKPELISYAGGESIGVQVEKPSDASKLTGSPADFQQFIADSVQKLIDEGSCTGEAALGISVEAVRTDGYAVGGVNECGGYQALWADVDGTWEEIDGTQDTWDCKILKQYTVPSDIAGDSCYDYHGDHQGHRYHQA